MKKLFLNLIIVCLLFFSPFSVWADNLDDLIEQADAAHKIFDLPSLKKSIELYTKALNTNPDSYEANWKCARAHRDYSEQSQYQMVEGWEEICAKYGKKGMQYAQKAIALEPEKVEGYFYYGLCVGSYADGVSILTALKENLKNKTQQAFEKAYAIDKKFGRCGSILALGRFWAVLPWPLKKKDKALAYLREYQKTSYFDSKDEPKGKIYLAELLIDMGGNKNRSEAKKWAEQVARSDIKFFREWAERLLAELK